MVGASSRLFLLLTSPLSLFRHRPSSLLRLTGRHSLPIPLPTISTVTDHLLLLSRANSLLPVKSLKSSRPFHSRTTTYALQESNSHPADDFIVPPSHPWPEWSNLLDSLSAAGYFDGNSNRIERTDIEDEFVANGNLSMEFVAAATSCLNFARDRPDFLGFLPSKDIQVLTESGTAFLFKNALETERRMRSFLEGEESNEAKTVDLMKYILSYASNPIIYPERNIEEAAESSVRNLLREMASLSCKGPVSHMSAPEQLQASLGDGQTPRNIGPNITMKRGDWICPRCNFMNFARNAECLECGDLRPRRQLTGGEWDCPQCNFFNYGRNVVCLKCECKRPGDVPLPMSHGQTSAASTRSIPSERPPVSQYQNGFGYNSGNNLRGTSKIPETSLNRNSDQNLGNSFSVTTSIGEGQIARKDGQAPIPKGSNDNYVPFVPLPTDMFAKKPEKMPNEDGKEAVIRSSELSSSKASDQIDTVSLSSEKLASQVDSRQVKDIDEEEKPESWFKKVAELHDDTDLARADDFPSIMPMRKGENRFVVSKKKDRSFNSATYKRQQAIEQGSNSNFVPFVPFPPDYFAKKDDKQQTKSTDSMGDSPSHMSCEKSNDAIRDKSTVEGTGNQGASITDNLNSNSSFDNAGPLVGGNTTANSSSSQVKETQGEASNVGQQAPENQNLRSGWTGKSLEGSAVKEPDPLDMSEEAKAERWFRRVAQIKDISELSQIPDEDFPSIMPMRKGVNRFVVSKRKTPLERRLTSPQYRKNLRVVSSDPIKKEGDGS